MKRKIAKVVLQTIEVSKCGKYCYEKRDGMERCGDFMWSRLPYCLAYGIDLNIEDNKPLRCQACIDAERMAGGME